MRSKMMGCREEHQSTHGSVLGGKPSHCVIYPPKSSIVAGELERRNNDWLNSSSSSGTYRFVRTKVASDLMVQVGDFSFHLHKLAMVSKSGYLNRLVFAKRSEGHGHNGGSLKIVLDDLPCGTNTFESIVNFCYGFKVDVTAASIAPLYCAANFLEMSDDLHQESSDTWWFQDVSTLRIDHFIQVIESIKRKGVKPELVGSCIAHWTAKWFSGTTFVFDDPTIPKHLTQKLQRITIESLINMLPAEKNSVSCNFLLYLVKLGLKIQVNSELLSKLETRIASMLEQCCAQDLLVKNYGDKDTTYDVGIVIRVVKAYVLLALKNSRARLCIVGRLIDGYLTLIARDINLKLIDFKLLVDALPTNARSCDNNLYRAIDMYLKAHPSLMEEERASVCKAMEYHRLSEDARQHAMRNGRLPLKIVTEFMLLEQVKMARSISASKSNINPRTTTQVIMKMNNKKCLEKGFIAPQKEIMLIRKEVENMKMQLNQLQMCKLKLQKQVQRSCIK
ncbi:hypothetical protein GOBAR_DD14715 [Gossypium barbadense]|nr:hypothetical protein GOBAR_DD14715 [Gossypium barbadense]